MKIKEKIYKEFHLLAPCLNYKWEIISKKHTSSIVSWRNDEKNTVFFESQVKISIESQDAFINSYDSYDRIDFVLVSNKSVPIGVFSIKNLESFPEYGSLIGSLEFRNKGIGSKAKRNILDFWFNVIGKDKLFVKNKIENEYVLKSNIKRGYSRISEENGLITFEITKESFLKN